MLSETTLLIVALDCSFVAKSGNKTHGLAQFWNGKQGKSEKSLKISTLAIIEMGFHQIGKMRCDANLRYLYAGEQKPKGRRKVYDRISMRISLH